MRFCNMKFAKHVKEALYIHHIALRITDNELDILNRMCKKFCKNRSEIIRQAIEEYYRTHYTESKD